MRTRSAIAALVLCASVDLPARPDAPTPQPVREATPPPPPSSGLDDWSILPLLFYSPETQLGFGLAVIYGLALPEDNPTVSTIAAGVIYTTAGQFITRLEPDLRFGDSLFVHGMIRYQRFPTRFFDPAVHLGDRGEPFDERSLLGDLDVRVQLTGPLRAGLRWDYRYNTLTELEPGGLLESSGDPGLGTWFASGIGPVLSFDTRDDPRLPRRGLLVDLSAVAWTSLTGAEHDALRVDLDVRGYLDLGRRHVLAGQLRAQLTAGTLPFQLQPRLGGASFLRGFYEGHLRNQHALVAQLEWRFPLDALIERVGGVVFAGLGESVRSLEDLSFTRLRAAGGLGVRYLLNKRQNVSVRLDFAWGSGLGVYFDVLEAF